MAGGSEKVIFPNPSGAGLAARLDRPAGEPRAFALFAHCFTCSKDIFAASAEAKQAISAMSPLKSCDVEKPQPQR